MSLNTHPAEYVFDLVGDRFLIDRQALYGYWTRQDGGEGGGLWLESGAEGIELSDFDGCSSLPRAIVNGLRAAGVIVSDDFNTYREEAMTPTHIVTTYSRNGTEQTACVLIEVCEPRSANDDETHRIRLIGDRVIRVSAAQLKPV